MSVKVSFILLSTLLMKFKSVMVVPLGKHGRGFYSSKIASLRYFSLLYVDLTKGIRAE